MGLKDVTLETTFTTEDAEDVKALLADEVLELVEGPRKEVLADTMRARVKLIPEGMNGWITITDKNGTIFACHNPKLFVCTQSIVMTEGEDAKESATIRKLTVGEILEAQGEPKVDEETKAERMQVKALKDGKEGWISTKGNAGTVYAESRSSYHSTTTEIELHKTFSSEGADAVKNLAVGHHFQVLEGPKGETTTPQTRAKVKTMKDGTTGWVSIKEDCVRKFLGMYKCTIAVSMHDSCDGADAKVLRELAKGETLELLSGPVFEEGKDTRVRCRSVLHGTVGWVTLKDSNGKRMLAC